MRPIHPFLRLFLILGVIFVVLGLARGWFYVSKSNDPDNKVNVHFTVDTQKVKEDSAKVKNAAEELGEKVVDETKQLQHKAAERDRPTAPPAPLEQTHNPAAQNPVPPNPPGSVLK